MRITFNFLKNEIVSASKIVHLVWSCSPRLVVVIFFSTIFSSILPFAQTVIGKYVLDSIIASANSHGAWIDIRSMMIFVGIEFLLVALGRNLTLFLELQREILGEIFSKDTSVRIITKTVSLDLSHFEDSEYYDKLQKAQRDGNYRPVQLLNQIFTLLENVVSIGSFFTLLLLFKWYFLFLIILATVPRTYVQFRYGRKKYDMINNRTQAQRKANYFSYILSNNIFAKEIKLFKLGEFFLERFSTALDKFYRENRNLAAKRTKANAYANGVAIVSSYGAYAIIIYDSILGSITIGSMTMYYQAFSRSQTALDSFLQTIAGLYENMLYINNYLQFMRIEGGIEKGAIHTDGGTSPASRDQEAGRHPAERDSLGFGRQRDRQKIEARGQESGDRRERIGEEAMSRKTEAGRKDGNVETEVGIRFENVSFAYPGWNGKAGSEAQSSKGTKAIGKARNQEPGARREKIEAGERSGRVGAPPAFLQNTEELTDGRLVLQNVSFEIKKGKTVAFIGENGAGKTTIVKLLVRLYDPVDGDIYLNGRNMKELDPEFIRKQMSVVFQDFNHYQLLVRENIGVGNIHEMEDISRIQEAGKITGVDSFINTLPQGYETQLGRWFSAGGSASGGKDGQELSIGQWQRIALARGFMRDAPILIFDEPTSHLDARAEYEIFESLKKFNRRSAPAEKDKIVIIISHRLKTVRIADKIIVLQKGRVIEEGTHEELMERNGAYAELFRLQAVGYMDAQQKQQTV